MAIRLLDISLLRGRLQVRSTIKTANITPTSTPSPFKASTTPDTNQQPVAAPALHSSAPPSAAALTGTKVSMASCSTTSSPSPLSPQTAPSSPPPPPNTPTYSGPCVAQAITSALSQASNTGSLSPRSQNGGSETSPSALGRVWMTSSGYWGS